MTTTERGIVIVGSGLAAWTVAKEFRKLDQNTPLTLMTQGNGDFYSKPMLSNALANGKSAAQLVGTAGAAMAQQLGVHLMAHTQVTAIDPTSQTVITQEGAIGYQRLVLATGAEPVRLPLQGAAAAQVLSVNDLQDYAQFRKQLEGAHRVTVIGAGLIGCEFANDLVAAGFAVDVIDPENHPLGRLVPAQVGDFVHKALTQAGVHFYLGTSVKAVHPSTTGFAVELANGQQLGSDLVLSAVGLRPRIGLAQAAGLHTQRGIVVGRQLQTSQNGIYALGDSAEVNGQVLPYVLPLMHSARTLAAHLAGQVVALRYPAMPVVVKIPAAPVVVSPVAPNTPGQWQVNSIAQGVDARFYGLAGELLGFALAGAATQLKSGLQKALPALLT